jgi:hypothetical protein
MKENDVRERVQAFLKNTVRLVVVPASMGIGLALIGCGDSAISTQPDSGPQMSSSAGKSGSGGVGGSASGGVGGSSSTGGAGGSVTVYSAPTFDAGAGGSGGLPLSHPAYMASLPYTSSSSGGYATKYSATMPTGGTSSARSLSSVGTGGSLPNITYGASWFNPSGGTGGTGGRGGTGGTYTSPTSSSGGVRTDGAVPDGGPAFDAGNSDQVSTGGTTTPVTRYGGIFPG